MSAHNPKVFTRVLKEYPQFSVIIFPYLFLTKELGGDSLLKLAQEKNVGVIGLKPFGAGQPSASSRGRFTARSIRGPACWSRKCSRSRGSRRLFPA